MSGSPVAVAVTGVSTGTIILAVIQVVLGGGVIAALVRAWPALKKISNEREANLLTERAEDMEAMRGDLAKLKAEMKQQQVQHQAERAVDRHRINNLQAIFDALVMLIEQDPSRAGDAVARIKEMRRQQIEAETIEKAAISAAAIQAAGAVT